MGIVDIVLLSSCSLKMILLLSLLFCFSLSNVVAECPEGWVDATEYDMGCLLLHDRELNHHQHSWGASNDFCNELGNNTRLVEIHTPARKEALTMLLIDHNGFYYWVGATDQRHEGTWLWGSMEPVQDFVWFENQPSTSAKQNCMFWSWEADGAGDDRCSFSIAIFPLCQRI